MMYYWNGSWGGMILAMLLNVAVWVLLLGGLIWAVSRIFNRRAPSSGPVEHGPSALEILRQRYARGEIDEATYERMRQRIDTTNTPEAHDTLPTPPGR